ncbi:DUF6471 domain-containing protein [Maritimibacter sp. HL-12]|uniref:DUF6471 domain-containing protein n=1 Tax=Maritimibacter sp. HL-12 TaxID=1162418 RepID=UPI000A0EF310|nr:DUF6471 domain-containing protein [Maritimibacter sp. HL-12]SMH56663.1 hypothetical protein SAMN05661107_3289 [Maritimibacter sp. HL-12]
MPDHTEWESKAANILKAELKRKGVTYAQLADMIGDKEVNIRNKLSRGKFSAAFLLQALDAVEVSDLHL